jgi:hypothetical protein
MKHSISNGTPMRKRIWVDLLVYPTHTLPIAAAPVMVGAALAARDHVFAPIAVVLAFLGSWLIHLAGLFTDTHELLRRYPQAVEHPDLTNALQDGTLTLGQIKVAIAAVPPAHGPVAVCFLVVGGVPALVIGLVGVVASFGYSAGPHPYTRLGIRRADILRDVRDRRRRRNLLCADRVARGSGLAARAQPRGAAPCGIPRRAAGRRARDQHPPYRRPRGSTVRREQGMAHARGLLRSRGSRLAYCFFSLLAYLAPSCSGASGDTVHGSCFPSRRCPWRCGSCQSS